MDSATVLQKWLHKNVPFNVETDFAPVAKMTNSTLLLCAQASFQCNSIKELVALARSEPGKLSCGTSGIGSPHHLDLLLSTRSPISISSTSPITRRWRR